MVVMGLVVASKGAFAQKAQINGRDKWLPLTEQSCSKPDTSLFTTKKIYAETADTSAARWAEGLVQKLEKCLAKCRNGKDFAGKAIESRSIFFTKYGMNQWGFLSEVQATGNAECSNMTSIYFTVAKRLGLKPKVAFADKHVFLIVGDWCMNIERGEAFPLADMGRRYNVHDVTDNEKKLMAIPYTNLGERAWAQGKVFETAGDSASALAKFEEAAAWAQKAIDASPGLPEPHMNLSLYCSKFDYRKSAREFSTYKRIMGGQPFDASMAYSAGLAMAKEGKYAGAALLFLDATTIDPDFAQADSMFLQMCAKFGYTQRIFHGKVNEGGGIEVGDGNLLIVERISEGSVTFALFGKDGMQDAGAVYEVGKDGNDGRWSLVGRLGIVLREASAGAAIVDVLLNPAKLP